MKVLMVMDQFLAANNGTTMTTQRFARILKETGCDVRVVCRSDAAPGQDGTAWTEPQPGFRIAVYPEQELRYPLVQGLIDKQGMAFARPDDGVLRQALEWCNVVHLVMASDLSYHAARLAHELGVPATAAFHVQPQNLSSSIRMGRLAPLNDLIFRLDRKYLYRYVDHVQCPSLMMARQLMAHGYTNALHVISNGIDPSFTYRRLPKSGDLVGRMVVTMVGRYSHEKRQDIVLHAVARSRYRDRIVLVLAGQGPTEHELRRLAHRLGVDARFGFLDPPHLHDVLAQTDVYVHASDMESEAMSCMEAFATGLVPIVSDSPLSATSQFALDDRSVFHAGDASDLARKLDWWLDHPDELERMGRAYAHEAECYRVRDCVARFRRMLEEAVRDARDGHTPAPGIRNDMALLATPEPASSSEPEAPTEEMDAPQQPARHIVADPRHVSKIKPEHVVHMPRWGTFSAPIGFDYLRDSPLQRVGTRAFRAVLDVVAALVTRGVLGFRLEGRENVRRLHGGFVSVCNHVHILDCGMVLQALRGKRTYILSIEENFTLPFCTHIVRWAGAVPVSPSFRQLREMMRSMGQALRAGCAVHVYPETALLPYCERLRPFAKGAFWLAVTNSVPVVPLVITQRTRRGLWRVLKRRPCLTLTCLPAIWPDPTLKRKDAVTDLAERCWQAMNARIQAS
jgi:1,2-diacylglycerol 3-alpha-glucosyltransferase